jgi:hypothetical protein
VRKNLFWLSDEQWERIETHLPTEPLSTVDLVVGRRIGEDPVSLGLVASLARPGGNATGINFFYRGGDGQAAAALA